MAKKPGFQKNKFLNQREQQYLLKKMQMKYGADLRVIEEQAKKDMEVYGYIRLETESMRESLLDKIKEQEKQYL